MNRNPERKNLFYSLLLAACLLLFLVSYFIYMLPSLYVDHLIDDNLKSIREQHRTYVETGSYEDIRVKNPTACFSVRIPYQGNAVFLASKSFSVQVTATEPKLQEKLHQLQALLGDTKQGSFSPDGTIKEDANRFFEEWETLFRDIMPTSDSLPIKIDFLQLQDLEAEYRNEFFRYHAISDRLFILESGVEDSNNSYATYIAVEKLDDALVCSLLPTVAPDINEIRPVIFGSLPVLVATVLFLVLLFSRIYSKGIVAPAQRLIAQSYEELEQKNRTLAEENKRTEVFLRSSSHQLKTPISAALLLIDGMIGKVGKYQDTSYYLPKVKEQLLSMRKIVENILSLSRLKDQLQLQTIDLDSLLASRLNSCQIAIADKNLSALCHQGNCGKVYADDRIVSLILDNLLSNAITHTPAGGNIEIHTSPGIIQIRNYGICIPENLLPHIFEPFVSGNNGSDGHGLGLYIASYYASILNASLSVTNERDSVLASITFTAIRNG